MRRTITAIIAFLIWILFVGLSLIIMDASLLLGIFAMAAFTIVILFGYVMIDDVMADLDEEEAKVKRRRKESRARKKFYTYGEDIPWWDTGKKQINVVIKFPTSENLKKKKRFSSFKEQLKKITSIKKGKEISVDLENGPITQKEYRGRNINKQTLD